MLVAFLSIKNWGYLVKKPMTWGFLAQIWTKKLTKNKYVTSPTPQNPIHTSPPSLHPFSFLSPFSPSHTFSPLLPHVFLFTPSPKIHPSPLIILPKPPYPPQSSTLKSSPSSPQFHLTQSSSPYLPLNPHLILL